jgi:hypothetical protein
VKAGIKLHYSATVRACSNVWTASGTRQIRVAELVDGQCIIGLARETSQWCSDKIGFAQ